MDILRTVSPHPQLGLFAGHQLLNNAPCEQVLPPFSTSLDTIANMSSTEANPAVGKASRWYPAEDTPQRKKVSALACDDGEMLVNHDGFDAVIPNLFTYN